MGVGKIDLEEFKRNVAVVDDDLSHKQKKIGSIIPLILWMSIVLILSFIPELPFGIEPELFIDPDKIAHFLFYGITSILLFKILRRNVSRNVSVLLAVSVSSFYGFMLELMQILIPWRFFSIGDIIANILGAIVLLFVYFFVFLNR